MRSSEPPASPQEQTEQDTTDATGNDSKEEKSEMHLIGRVSPELDRERLQGNLENAVDEEKAPQVYQAIQIQICFKPFLSPCDFAHQKHEGSQVGENRVNQDEAQRLPAGGEGGNIVQIGIIRRGVRKREEPEDQQLTRTTAALNILNNNMISSNCCSRIERAR